MPIENPERAKQEAAEIFAELSELEKMIGTSEALAAKKDATKKNLNGPDVQADIREMEDKLAKEAQLKFEELVQYGAMKRFTELQYLQQHPEHVQSMSTLEQISLQMTLWKYEELNIKEYLDVIKRYKATVEKNPALHSDEAIRLLESKLLDSMRQIKAVLPALRNSIHIAWCMDTLEEDKKTGFMTPEQRKGIESTLARLRASLPNKNDLPESIRETALHKASTPEEMREARYALSGKMRSLLQETAPVSAGKSEMGVQLPHAVYIRALNVQRDSSFQEFKDSEAPTVEQYTKFLDIQRQINAESLQYHVHKLKDNADTIQLLAFRERFGPEMEERYKSNPAFAQDLTDFYEKFLLPGELGNALKDTELKRYTAGMEEYLKIIDTDVLNYGSWVDHLDNVLLKAKNLEELAMRVKHGTAEIAYFVPEHTLGYARFIGLDYAKLIGQEEELKNHRAVLDFLKLEKETESIKAILEAAKPGIQASRALISADQQALLELQKKHPPEACVPGQMHSGVPYDVIKKQYDDTITQLRDHHAELLEKIEDFYEQLSANVQYHAGRAAANELLNNVNAPNKLLGFVLSGAIIGTPVAYKYGGKGGVRSLPGVGRALRPFRNIEGPLWQRFLKGIANAPGRVINAPTRFVMNRTWLTAILPTVPFDTPEGARLVRLSAENARLQQQLADALRQNGVQQISQSVSESTSPGAQAAREQVQRVLSSERVRQLFAKIQESALSLDRVRGNITAAEKALETASDAERIAKNLELAQLRTQYDNLLSIDRSLRVQASKVMLERRLFLLPAQRQAIWQAHLAGTIREKVEILSKVFKKSKDIEVLIHSGLCGNVEGPLAFAEQRAMANGAGVLDDLRFMNTVGAAGVEGSRALATAERQLPRNWSASKVLGKTMKYGGRALAAYIIYSDIQAVEQAEEFHKQASKQIKDDLEGLVASGSLKKVSETVYTIGGCTIDISKLVTDTAKTASERRLALDAGLIAGGTVLGGPFGLVAALGVDIAGRIAIGGFEHADYYKFMREAPLWLIARFGAAGLTGSSEYQLVQDKPDDWVAEYFEQKDLELRKKLFFSHFISTLRSQKPHLFESLSRLWGSPEEAKNFFEGDFQSIVLETFYIEIFMRGRRADLPMNFIRGLDTDRVTNPFPGLVASDISAKDFEAAMVAAGEIMASKHQESLYLAELQEFEAETDPLAKELLRTRVYELGSARIFGRRLLDSNEELALNGGKTRAELLVARFRDTLSTASGGGSWQDIMSKNLPGVPFRDDAYEIKTDGAGTPFLSWKEGQDPSEGTFSTYRRAMISLDGIHGLYDIGKTEMFTTIGFGPSTTDTPPVEGAVPDVLESEFGEEAVVALDDSRSQLAEGREYLKAERTDIIRLTSYVQYRAQVEALEPLEAKARAALEAFSAPGTIYPTDAGGRAERARELRRLETELKNVATALEDARGRLAAVKESQFRKDFKNQEDLIMLQTLDQQPVGVLASQLEQRKSEYLLYLQNVEESTRAFNEEVTALRSRTDTIRHEFARSSLFGGREDAKLGERLYGSATTPIVLSSGIDIEKDVLVLQQLADAARNVKQTLRNELFAVHFQKKEGANGEMQYLVTCLSAPGSSRGYPSEADKDAFSYVQIAAVQQGGSGYVELGLPFAEYERLSYLTESGDENYLFEQAMSVIEERQSDTARDLIAKMSVEERTFRAGRAEGRLTQIDRNLWGVRIGNRFILIRKNTDTGAVEAKLLPIGTKVDDSFEASARRTIRAFETARETGAAYEPRLNEEEKASAKDLFARLDGEQWGAVPTELVERYNLRSDVSPDDFNAVRLPDGILNQLSSAPSSAVFFGRHVQELGPVPLNPQQAVMLDSLLDGYFARIPIDPLVRSIILDKLKDQLNGGRIGDARQLREAMHQALIQTQNALPNQGVDLLTPFDTLR